MSSVQTDRFAGLTAGEAIKAPCLAATTGNITLSGEQTIDDVAVTENDRVFVRAQTDPVENGIYVVSTGSWTRAEDMDGNRDIRKGTIIVVATGGTTYGPSLWSITADDPITIDTTEITSQQQLNQVTGVSAFVETLLDDANAAEFLGTLGFSAFIQTLINDADAGTARATIGAYASAGGTISGNVTLDGVDLIVNDDADVVDENGESRLPQVGEIFYMYSTTHAHAIMQYGQTIGSGASGADLANDKYENLYLHLWDNVADGQAAVTGGRGASAAADWAADKPLATVDHRGRTPLGKDNMGGSSANVVTDSEADTIGDLFGEEEHTPTSDEMFQHAHTGGAHTHGAGSLVGGGSNSTGSDVHFTIGSGTDGDTDNIEGNTASGGAVSTSNAGSSNAFNIIQPSVTLNCFIRY